MKESIDIILGFLFFAWWFICLKLLSIYTGWQNLGRKYGFKGNFDGTILRCQGSRGGTHIGANEDGLYLAVLFVFRPFHRPLLIPWHDLKVIKTQKYFTTGYKIVFPSVPKAEFFFRDKTFDKLAEVAPEKLKEILKGAD